MVDLIESADLSDVTLVGHSWGGYVITGAAHRVASRLRKLVYWSAFVPAAGRSLYDEVPPAYRELFDAQAAASGNNTVALPLPVWQEAFMNDAGEEAQKLVHELLVPHPMQYFTETVEPLDPAALGCRCPTCCPPTTSRSRPASTAGTASRPGSGSRR